MPGELDAVRLRMVAAATAATKRVGEDLLGRAQREAPLEEGTLRASGHVEIEHTPHEVTAVVSFNTPYAARQHEETSWMHPRAGKAKYLEDPLKEMAGRYRAVLEAAVRKAL
jgi:hypothetical protein